MKTKFVILMLIVSVAIIFTACSDRGINSSNLPPISEGGVTTVEGSQVFNSYFPMQINNTFRQLKITAYQPRIAFPPVNGGELKSVPVVILFAPQDGNENYFFRYGLKEIADDMIASGEIEPMSIVCIPNDKVFGGYFYAGHSPAAGFYDDFLSEKLIDYIYTEFLFDPIDTAILKPGLGGVGMGSYGAMRLAIRNPGMFNSITVTDGPLDFDGADGNSGLIDLFSNSLIEQGLMGADGWKAVYDTSSLWHTTRLIVGGAYAFSPHDTAVIYHDTVIANTATPELGDVIGVALIDFRFSINDPESYIENAIGSDPLKDHNFDFHLPFDSSGSINPTIWDMWLENNLETMLGNNPTALDNVDIWIAHSDEFTFANYGPQTVSFINTLQVNHTVDVFNYAGWGDLPADNDQYMHDLIRKMLRYHSAKFND